MKDEPCFMPVVPANQFHGLKGVHDLSAERLEKTANTRLLVVIDSTQKLEGIVANLEILLDHLDNLVIRRRILDAEANGRMKEEFDLADYRDEDRMTWSKYDLYLAVHDFLRVKKSKAGRESPKKQYVEFYETHNLLVPEIGKLVSAADAKRAEDNFDFWKNEANTLVEDFWKIT